MTKTNKIDTQAVGLDFGLAFSKFLTGKENLHYGLWADDLPVCAANVGVAQEAYTEKLFRLLPDRKGLRILDIGGGAGETAKKLVALGHTVDIVIPSAFLAERCRENGGPTVNVHECKFEDFDTNERFDVCLFSESFQYIPLEIALDKAATFLEGGGCIIIADCFRSEGFHQKTEGAKVGGGHPLAKFREAFESRPFKMVSEEDITQAVAPSVDIEQELFNVIGYGIGRIDTAFAETHPVLRWGAHKVFGLIVNKRRRMRLNQRLNEKTRTSENFCLYNTYLMMKIEPAG